MTDANQETAGAVSETEKPQKIKTKSKIEKGTEDLLQQIVQDIGALSAADAIAAIPALLDGADENYFRLGGVFSRISKEKLYETEGFDTFKVFVETKYGIQYRKAMYWVSIYDTLIESGVPWNKVKDVGWTKLKDLASILTLENVDEWVNRALVSTVLQLQDAISKHKTGTLANSGITPEDEHKSATTTFTVKVHEDQKTVIREAVDKAKGEANTEYDGVALESICMNYLAGGNASKPQALDVVLKKHTPEDILTAFETAFPEFEVTAKLKAHKKSA
jgi:hypothetical protein